MQSEDLLLLEVQIIDESALQDNQFETTKRLATFEYSNKVFQSFADSALKQYCDIPLSAKERGNYYKVDVCQEVWNISNANYHLLQIDCLFKNIGAEDLNIIFLNDRIDTLKTGESIRLYRSRKFPEETLINFIKYSGLEVIAQECFISNQTLGFGFMVLMLKRSKNPIDDQSTPTSN